MKQTKWFKRALSGIMTVLMLISAAGVPIPAYAADLGPVDDLVVYVAALPSLEEVADQLDEGERVTAGDYELSAGTETDLNADFTNISFDGEKVKVSFFEAKNAAGQSFTHSLPDTYQAIYYVEPFSGHPAYKFSRTITVVEYASVEAADLTENNAEDLATPAEDSGDDEEEADIELPLEMTVVGEEWNEAEPVDEEASAEAAEESIVGAPADAVLGEETSMNENPNAEMISSDSVDAIPEEDMIIVTEEEMNAMLEEAENQETTDWETGMTVSGVLIWASEKEKINLLGMTAGETASFKMPLLQGANRSASTEYVSITKGDNYYYETYGLGSYVTSPYYIVFGNISAVAFCVQPALPGPGDGVYTIEQVWDNAELAKVIYYGTDASGSDNFFDNYYPSYSTVVRFIITHIAASYANGSSDAFTGANETAQELAMQLYYYAVSQPEIPDMTMSFSNSNVSAYRDGDIQRTENVTFNANSSQSIVMNLPDGVVFHNVTTGATSSPGASVTVSGGTTFYLSAPLSQTGDSGGSWSSTMHGSILEDYAAYKITTGWDVQDLAFVFGESSQHEQTVSFSVSWLSLARIFITKTDEASGKNLAGAVFGVYSDPGCTDLIIQMPATDANGSSSVEITATQDTVYLKEITPPKGYVYTASALNVRVVAGQDSSLTITNKEIKGSLTIYKEGEVLTGATVTENGVSFQYEDRRLPGASYRVSAAEDIIAADGTMVYRQDEVVADNLITGSDGSVTLSDLHLGTYAVTETGAPKNYLNEGMTKKAALTYSDPSQEVVMDSVTFENERQRVIVTAEKKDKLTETSIPGATFGLYAGKEILSHAGEMLVKPDTLIATATTGNDGIGAFYTDLPLNTRYYVKELTSPIGYKLNESEEYSFTTSYTNEREEMISFSHTFMNEEIRGNLTIYKEGEVLTGVNTSDNGVTFQYEVHRQSGATFNVYAGAEIKSSGGTLVFQKGDLVAENLVTGADGSVTLNDLFLGTYTIIETSAPRNFVISGESKEVTLSPEASSGETIMDSVTFRNERQKVCVVIKKADSVTKNPLPGGVYGLYAAEAINNADGEALVQKDTLIEKATTSADGTATFKTDLPLNANYYVKELQAPKQYVRNETDVFTFIAAYSEDAEPEIKFSYTFENERVNARIDLVKVDLETGAQTQGDSSLEGATYGLYAREDIVHPDGKTGVIYEKDVQIATLTTDKDGKKDELVGTITTDNTGVATLANLPVGKYYVKEVNTAHGYVLDQELRYVDLSYRDQNTPVVSFDESWQNNRQRVTVHVQKVEKDSNKPLAGGVFGLFTAEDIKSASGKTLVKKGTIIELKSTDADGKIVFVADLPVDGKFYVQEQYAPNGYVTDHEKKEFTFDYGTADQAEIVYEFVFVNEPTTVAFSKLEITGDHEIPGAHLELRDSKGNLVEEWVSTETPHIIQRLHAGMEYSLIETKPADGYVTAEKVTFTVEDSYNLQRVEMKDDVTKVEITKTDITTGKELPGAKLTILDKDGKVVATWVSTDKPTYIEKLPIGDYTLCEESAPNGYLKAENVKFTVKDTGEIQKVEMKDSPIKTPDNPETPRTGDSYKPFLLVGGIVLGLAMLGVSVVLAKKKRY